MAGLEDYVELDVSQGLEAIGRLEDATTALTDRLAADLSSALEQLDAGAAVTIDDSAVTALVEQLAGLPDTVPITVEVDAAQVESLAETLAGLPDTVAVTVEADTAALSLDASAVTVEIDQDSLDFAAAQIEALGETPVVVSVVLDEATLAEADQTLIALGETLPPIVLAVDTSAVLAAGADLEDLAGQLEGLDGQSAAVNVDSGGVDQATASIGGATEATKGLGAEGAGLAGAFGTGISLAKGNVSGLLGTLGGAAAPVAAVAAGVGVLFEASEKAAAANERLALVFGDQADAVKSINVGGLTGQLGDLALTAGSSGAQLKQAVSNIGQVGLTAGKSSAEVVPFTQNVAALSLRAVALNPALGQAGDVANLMFRALGRGGPILTRFGLSLTASQIAAEALKETGKASAKELTTYEKATAGAALATRQLGQSLGEDFAKGSEQGAVRLKSLKAELGKGLAEAGAPLVEPIIEALTSLVPVAVEVAHGIGDAAQVFLVPLRLVVPIVEAIGAVLGHLPTGPLLTAVAAFVTFQTAARLGLRLGEAFFQVAGKLAGALGQAGAAAKLEGMAVGARNVDTSTGALLRFKGGAEGAAAGSDTATAAAERQGLAAEGAAAGTDTQAASALSGTGANEALAVSEDTAAVSADTLEVSTLSAGAGIDAAALSATGGAVQLDLFAVAEDTVVAGADGAQLSLFGLTLAEEEAALAAVGASGALEAEALAAEGAGAASASAGVGFAAMLGPIALIVAGGVALASFLGVFKKEVDHSGEALKAWTGILESAGEEMTNAQAAALATSDAIAGVGSAATRDAGVKALEESLGGYVDALHRAGLTSGDFFDAVDEGGSTLTAFRQQLVDAGEVSLDLSNAQLGSTVTAEDAAAAQRLFAAEYVRTGSSAAALSAAMESLGQNLSESAIHGQTLTDVVRDNAEAQRQATAAVLAGAVAEIDNGKAQETTNIRRLAAAGHLDLLKGKQLEVARTLLVNADALDEEGKAAEAAATAEGAKAAADERAKQTTDALSASVNESSSAYDAAKSALDRYLGKPLDVAAQQLQLETSVTGLASAFKDQDAAAITAAGTLDLTTEGGQKVAQSLQGAAKSGLDWAKSLAEQGKHREAVDFVKTYRQRLIEQAGGSETARKAVDAYLTTLGLTPEAVDTKITASDVDKADRDVREWDQLLGFLPKEKAVQFLALDDNERAKAISDYVQKLDPEKRIQFIAQLNQHDLDIVDGKLRAFQQPRHAAINAQVNGADQANRDLDSAARDRSATIHARVDLDRHAIIVGTSVTPIYLRAQGGVDDPEHRAFIAGAGTPIRVFNEPETGGEAYIPLADAKRPRSTAILSDVAGRFGYQLERSAGARPASGRLGVEQEALRRQIEAAMRAHDGRLAEDLTGRLLRTLTQAQRNAFHLWMRGVASAIPPAAPARTAEPRTPPRPARPGRRTEPDDPWAKLGVEVHALTLAERAGTNATRANTSALGRVAQRLAVVAAHDRPLASAALDRGVGALQAAAAALETAARRPPPAAPSTAHSETWRIGQLNLNATESGGRDLLADLVRSSTP